MCKIPLNSPVQTVEPDIVFSEDETEVSWSEIDSTISSSATAIDTSTSSDLSTTTISRSFSSAATTTSLDDDFYGFTDDDLAFYGLVEEFEEYHLSEYLDDSDECAEHWNTTDELDVNEESDMEESNPLMINWDDVQFDDGDYITSESSTPSQESSNYLKTPPTTESNYHDSDGYESTFFNDLFDDKLQNSNESSLMDDCKEQIDKSYDISMIALPGEEDNLFSASQDGSDKWIPYALDEPNNEPVLYTGLVVMEPFYCGDLLNLQNAMSPHRKCSGLTTIQQNDFVGS